MRLDHFSTMDEMVVEPAFLVRGVDSTDVFDRLQTRMAAQDVDLEKPRTSRALNGMARIGLAMEQQDALVDALTGEYAGKVWGDKLDTLKTVYPAGLVDALCGQAEMEAAQIHESVQSALDTIDASDEDQLALEFLYRAWLLRRRVVIEGRPMSLIPVIGGDDQGDTPLFTPVLQRQNGSGWQLGRPGDAVPVSPLLIEKADVREAVCKAQSVYSEWYHKTQEKILDRIQKRAGNAPLSFGAMVPVWEYLLRNQILSFGGSKVTLENVNHNRLFRFRYLDGEVFRHLIFEMAAGNAAMLAIKTAGGVQADEYPTVAEFEACYLDLMGGRNAKATITETPFEPVYAKPLESASGATAFRVATKAETMTVAWVQHPKAIAVVSGDNYKARAIVAAKGEQLGVFPVTPKSKKPDMKDMWQGSTTPGLDFRNDAVAQRALSAWLAWLWKKKAGLKKYQD